MPTRRTLLASAALATVGTMTARAPTLGSAPVPAGAAVTTETAVVYGEAGGEKLLLDVYRPPARDRLRPAVLLFHGGGLTFGDRTFMAEHAQRLAEAGYVAFTIDYRLFSEADGRNPWPAQLDDAQRAVRWVRANAADYGIEPSHLGVLGHSSGATLAAHLGTRDTRDNADPALAAYSSRVKCVVDIAGGMDATTPAPDPDSAAALAALLGGTLAEVPDAYRDFSPMSHIDEHTGPFLILHGAQDTMSPAAQSRRMADALHAAELEVVYGEFFHIGHLDWDWTRSGPWALAFFGVQLHPDW